MNDSYKTFCYLHHLGVVKLLIMQQYVTFSFLSALILLAQFKPF